MKNNEAKKFNQIKDNKKITKNKKQEYLIIKF